MKTLSKSKAYDLLFKISKKQNLNIDKYIEMMSNSGNTIPIDVILFINKYKSSSIPQLDTFNIIYERRFTNPLYKNIMNESATSIEQCLALNSIVTQCLIRVKSLNDYDKEEFLDLMNIKDILDAIEGYLVDNDTEKLRTIFFKIRAIFKNLFGNNHNN